MERCVDGNTGNTQFVFIENGVIGTSLPLDIEYTHDNCAFELGFVAAQLLEMAQRYYCSRPNCYRKFSQFIHHKISRFYDEFATLPS